MKNPLQVKKEGLYCSEGDFFIDAWGPVSNCLITHAHADHTYFGNKFYIAPNFSLELLQYRLGLDASIQTYPYGQKFKMKECWVSFHPSGHILGSAQIRIETKKGVCVVSGDYKRSFDLTCHPFELVPCDLFVTESTFALPIYNWEASEDIAKKIYTWWQENQELGFASVLYCYAVGKAQRILSLLASLTEKSIYVHGAILPICEIYAKHGISLGSFLPISDNTKFSFAKELILAPPIAKGSPWLRRFYPYKSAFASGWMAVRGFRKQKNVDTGFALSDHADWTELLTTIYETQASTILTTHGNALTLANYLKQEGLNAAHLKGLEEIDQEID